MKYILYRIYYSDNIIYLGRTKQKINDRLRGHFFSKPMHKTISIHNVNKIEIAECKTESDMTVYEVYYINKLKPVLNRDDKAYDELTIELPELNWIEHNCHLLEKWKDQIRR